MAVYDDRRSICLVKTDFASVTQMLLNSDPTTVNAKCAADYLHSVQPASGEPPP